MKKLLIITRDFPPYAGSGNIMRIFKFAKYLPEFDWQPFVISEKLRKMEDDSLLKKLPSSVRSFHIESNSPQNKKEFYKNELRNNPALPFFKKLRFLTYRHIGYNFISLYINYFLAPDKSSYWSRDVIPEAKRLHNENNFDAIFVSGPPFSTFQAGFELKQELRLPLILDFRDGWVGNSYFYKKNQTYIEWKNKKIESKAVHLADLIIFVTEPLLEIYRKRYPGVAKKMVLITNGFDPEDFKAIEIKESNKSYLKFVYSGTVSGKRSPYYFLKGLQLAFQEKPDIRNKIRVHFIGKFKYDNDELLKSLSDVLTLEGQFEHKAALGKISDADIFVFLSNPGIGGRTVMTGKIFEYLFFNKPVFAVSDPCAATDLIKKLNAGYIADYSNIDEIKDQIISIYNDWKSNKLIRRANPDDIRQFERRNLTRMLSEQLDKIILEKDRNSL